MIPGEPDPKAAFGCIAFLLDRESRYIALAKERYAAESAKEPRHMSVTLVPRSIRVEGDAGRTIRTRTTFAIENRGSRPETHLGFALHRGLDIRKVNTTCGKARVARQWERLGIDLDSPIAPNGTCTVTIDVEGQPDAIVFNLRGKGRFGARYRRWERATTAMEDMSHPCASGLHVLVVSCRPYDAQATSPAVPARTARPTSSGRVNGSGATLAAPLRSGP